MCQNGICKQEDDSFHRFGYIFLSNDGAFNNNHDGMMSDNPHLWRTYCVTGSILDDSHAFSPFIFTMTLLSNAVIPE